MARKGLTYSGAGVDIDEGARLVDLIKAGVKSTTRPEVTGGIGGFGGLFSGRFEGYEDPVLVSATDGVGTKLMVAIAADHHDTVGVDLVAMSVNDVVTTGAEPLFFLDYLATGSLDAEKMSRVVKGIARGCREAGCALIGGETAEMPGMYKGGDYDLAGFCVGVVDRKKMIDGSAIAPGDAVIGLASSGLHSNGYSLARKVLFDKLKLKVTDKPRGLKKTVGRELLTPTRIYVKPLLEMMKKFTVKGLVHVTGGGFQENLPRIMPDGTAAVVRKGSWPVPKVFTLIQEGGNIEDAEMMRTFNCGIGMAVFVPAGEAEAVVETSEKAGIEAWAVGTVVKGKGKPRVETEEVKSAFRKRRLQGK